MPEKVHLGGGVYAAIDGGEIVLTTETGHPYEAGNRIVLSPEVLAGLDQFLARYGIEMPHCRGGAVG